MGSGGKGDNVDPLFEFFQFFLLSDAEPVFFVDDHQAEFVESDVVSQQAVCADDDVDIAV